MKKTCQSTSRGGKHDALFLQKNVIHDERKMSPNRMIFTSHVMGKLSRDMKRLRKEIFIGLFPDYLVAREGLVQC